MFFFFCCCFFFVFCFRSVFFCFAFYFFLFFCFCFHFLGFFLLFFWQLSESLVRWVIVSCCFVSSSVLTVGNDWWFLLNRVNVVRLVSPCFVFCCVGVGFSCQKNVAQMFIIPLSLMLLISSFPPLVTPHI